MQLEQLDGQLEAADFQQLLNEDPTLALVLYALSHLTGHWLPQKMILMRICLVFDSKVTVYTHTHTLTHSLVLVVMMRSMKVKTSRYSHADSQILSHLAAASSCARSICKSHWLLLQTHAHQRAASLAGQLVRSHKLQCAYFEECIQCKALELQPLQETLRAEKAGCEQAKVQRPSQHHVFST